LTQEICEDGGVSTSLRVGVAGFWHVHAASYAARAQEHPETELVAVWDDDPDRRAEAAGQFGVEGVASLEELIDRTDGVIVTTATSAHHEVMITLAEAGRHMFAEKVLAPTLGQAGDIIAAADRSGVTLMVSLPQLYHGYTQTLLELVSSERLGLLTYGRVRLCHNGATTGWLPERFFDPEEAVGGALIDLGCHPAYLTQLFLGDRPETVDACYRSVTGRAVEDQAVVTLGYPDGAIGVIETGFVSDPGFSIELFGTGGSARYCDDGSGLLIRTPTEMTSVPLLPDGQDAFGQWVDHVRTGTRADDNLARAIELTRLIVAANNAAASGRTVRY
jgi:1,5-anhydro-D-fructose reductase (1,5-anhydro-D-mannitol-forming)